MSQSRIGKLPIPLPMNVDIIIDKNILKIKGKFGNLTRKIPEIIFIEQKNKLIYVKIKTTKRKARRLHGLFRTLISNMIIGVSKQFTYVVKLIGVGYRAECTEDNLILNLGYSHEIKLQIPPEIKVVLIAPTTIQLVGCNNEKLGLFAAKIRACRPPEPYKGKGIIYENELIRRKIGKSGKK